MTTTYKRRYTAQIKSDAIERLKTCGYPYQRGTLEQVSREFSIPAATLRYWFHNPSLEVRQRITKMPERFQVPTIPTTESPSAPSSSAEPPENSPTVATTTDEPATAPKPDDTIAFYAAELAQIRLMLHQHRENASYKDLLQSYRLLLSDIKTLQTQSEADRVSIEEARARFHELLFSVPYVGPDAEPSTDENLAFDTDINPI